MTSLIFEYPIWFLLVCFALAFLYAFGMYFRDKKLSEVSKKKIALLASLRFLATLIISVLLLTPLLKSLRTTIEEPLLIFANDNSESIALSYNTKNDKLQQIQKNITATYNDIGKDFDAKAYSFGNRMNADFSFEYKDKVTNINSVFDEITDKYYNKNIGAVILISDGIYTTGVNPLNKVENVKYPVYTVAMGDTTIYKDLLIKDLTHNEIAFYKNKFPLEVTIVAKKLKGQTATCKISHNGTLLFSESFEITDNDFLKKIRFFIEAKNVGIQNYNVSLTKLSGERNTKNNVGNFAIKVVENKQKILILTNSPNPDVAAFRSALKSNQNFEVEYFTIDDFNKDIADYSLIILYQLPSKKRGLTNLYPQMLKQKVPVLFVLGTQSDFKRLNTLNAGVTVQQSNKSFDFVQGYENVNFSEFEISEEFGNILRTVPPLLVPFGEFKVIPQAKIAYYQRVRGINTLKPLLTISTNTPNYESNVGFLMGEGIWRWRFYDFKKNGSFELFDNAINQIVQYLVLKESKNKFIVKVKNIISENDDVVFKAQAYNKIFELTNENDVDIVIKDSLGKEYEFKMQKNQNSYVLNIGNMPVGNYTFSAKTKIADQNFKTAGKFSVTKLNIEALNLVANHRLLYKIAQKSGGKFLYVSDLDSLGVYLENDPNIVSVSYSTLDLTDVIKFKWIFFLILTILSVEWFLRKFFGTY